MLLFWWFVGHFSTPLNGPANTTISLDQSEAWKIGLRTIKTISFLASVAKTLRNCAKWALLRSGRALFIFLGAWKFALFSPFGRFFKIFYGFPPDKFWAAHNGGGVVSSSETGDTFSLDRRAERTQRRHTPSGGVSQGETFTGTEKFHPPDKKPGGEQTG